MFTCKRSATERAMKLFDAGKTPNPRRVRIFFAEKNIPLPEIIPVDLTKLEQKTSAFIKLNPSGLTPVLILDDGTALSETMAICRYLEALHPEPALFGTGAKGQAIVEMWNRRIEFGLYLTAQAVFRHSHPAMAQLEVPQLPEWAEANRPRVIQNLAILDEQLAGNAFVCGDSFSVADITAGIMVDFLRWARMAVPPEMVNILRWHTSLVARPSWSA
jgi:glutathione S-transferase